MDIGVKKLVEVVCAGGGTTVTLSAPTGREYLVSMLIGKHNLTGAQNLYWTLMYNSVTYVDSAIINLASGVYTSLETAFPGIITQGPLVINSRNTVKITGPSEALKIYTIDAYVLERPENYDLQAVEWELTGRQEGLPPGLTDLINTELGYRTRTQRL